MAHALVLTQVGKICTLLLTMPGRVRHHFSAGFPLSLTWFLVKTKLLTSGELEGPIHGARSRIFPSGNFLYCV